MGFYIETPGHQFGKAQILCTDHGAKVVKMSSGPITGWDRLERIVEDHKQVLIAVVQNQDFDGAMIVYDMNELDRIRNSVERGDRRAISWLTMEPSVVRKLNVSVPMVD